MSEMPKIEQILKQEKPPINDEETLSEKDRKFFDEVDSKLINLMGKMKKGALKSKVFNELTTDLKNHFPNRLAELNIFFDFLPKKYYQKLEENQSERKRLPTDMVTKLTEFIYRNVDNSAYVSRFWGEISKIGERLGHKKNWFKNYKKGIVVQVAAAKILEAIGYKIRFATPEEDAWEQTDLFLISGERQIPIQVKAGKAKVREGTKLKVFLSDVIKYPAIQVADENLSQNDIFITATEFDEVVSAAETVEARDKRTGRKTFVFKLRIPINEKFLNVITGKPTEECVGKMAKELEDRIQSVGKDEVEIEVE